MKLAIILRGISYFSSKENVNFSASKEVDYRLCLEKMKENLIKPLETIFEHIDFFIVTYNSEKIKDVITDFKPKDIMVYPSSYMESINKQGPSNFMIVSSLNLIENYVSNYDHILCTRFDLYYYKPLDVNKLKFDTINFAWIGPSGQADDQWLFFQEKHIEKMKKFLLSKGFIHNINSLYGNCNYLSRLEPEKGYHMPDFYYIYRFKSEIGKSITLQ
jgi:hypothetical protein